MNENILIAIKSLNPRQIIKGLAKILSIYKNEVLHKLLIILDQYQCIKIYKNKDSLNLYIKNL